MDPWKFPDVDLFYKLRRIVRRLVGLLTPHRYIDTRAIPGGDGRTPHLEGEHRAYSSINEALAAEDIHGRMRFFCKGDE